MTTSAAIGTAKVPSLEHVTLRKFWTKRKKVMMMKRVKVKVVVTKISQHLIPLMKSVPKSQNRNNLANLMKS